MTTLITAAKETSAEQFAKNSYELELIMQSALFFLLFSFLACLHVGHFFL